jgi:hypothetical protein
MPLSFSNFVRTTLRSPVTPSDTMLLLEAGSGVLFGLSPGDYCYVTVNDGVTVEVMKYTSIGPVINDTIPVARGQDGTTAKAFPAGACVQVAWNKAQVADFVTQLYNEMFDAALLGSDTIQVTTTPTSPPPGGVHYAVRVDTHQMWYWDPNTPAWIELGNISNGIVVTGANPTAPPGPNVRFAINTADGSLWYWNNTAWLRISSEAESSGAEIWTRDTTNTSPIVLNPGAYTGSTFSWADHVHWQANPSIASNLVWDASGAFKVNHDALVIVSCGVNAEAGTVGVHGAGKLVLTTSDPAFPTGEWGTDFVFDTFTTSGATVLNAITTPLLVHLNSLLGMNLIFDIGSVGTLKVHKIFFSVEILALQ